MSFRKIIDIWYGKLSRVDMQLQGVKKLAQIADQSQMTEIVPTLDETVVRHLSTPASVCGEVLNRSGELGLRKS